MIYLSVLVSFAHFISISSDHLTKHLTFLGEMLVKHCLTNPESDIRYLQAGCECLGQNIKIMAVHFKPKFEAYLGKISIKDDWISKNVLGFS